MTDPAASRRTPYVQARADAVQRLLTEGPGTIEELTRKLRGLALPTSPSVLRKILAEAWARKEVSRKIVKSERYRVGVSVWFLVGEDAEVLQPYVETLGALKPLTPGFRLGVFGRPRPAIDDD